MLQFVILSFRRVPEPDSHLHVLEQNSCPYPYLLLLERITCSSISSLISSSEYNLLIISSSTLMFVTFIHCAKSSSEQLLIQNFDLNVGVHCNIPCPYCRFFVTSSQVVSSRLRLGLLSLMMYSLHTGTYG